ncbi:hypothetical protein Cpir12675_001257, partial [Ceratocystis pirilliformis]
QADILSDSGYFTGKFTEPGIGNGYIVTYASKMVNAILISEDLKASTFFAIENYLEPDHDTKLTLTEIFHAVLARENADYNNLEQISFDYLDPDLEDLVDGYRFVNDIPDTKEISIISGNTRWNQFAKSDLNIIVQELVPSRTASRFSFTKDIPSAMSFYERKGMYNRMHIYLAPKLVKG